MQKIIIALIIFSVIILIHEFGHFAVAKLCNIKVNKFALGMGPCLLKKQWGETEYSIRLLPIGGFCAMEGEDDKSDNERAFGNKPVWQRICVVAAGAIMNVILGLVLIIITTCMNKVIPTTIVDEFHTDNNNIIASSYNTGLREGDKIINMNGMSIWSEKDLVYKLQSTDENSFDLVVKRNGEKVKLNNVKFEDTKTNGRLDFYLIPAKKTVTNVIGYSFRSTASTAKLIWMSLIDLISGKYGFHELSGPVGLIDAIGDASKAGENISEHIQSVMGLTIFITVNLGIFNLLPIPGLDGGRLIFLIIEAVRRKPIKPEHEGMVHLIGMAMLMFLILLVTFSDIKKIIS